MLNVNDSPKIYRYGDLFTIKQEDKAQIQAALKSLKEINVSTNSPLDNKIEAISHNIGSSSNQTGKILAWAADLHFDRASEEEISAFIDSVNQQNPSVLLLAGDIDLGKEIKYADSSNPSGPPNALVATILKIKAKVECDIYFVCGNHDFYYSSFSKIRESTNHLSNSVEGIKYIHDRPGIELDSETILVGHDGWADGRSGNFWGSDIVMRDFFEIEDFDLEGLTQIKDPRIKEKLEQLGDQSAEYAEKTLPDLLKKYRRVVFLTHVPPFRKASWNRGAVTTDEGAPFFVNKALGKSLKRIMEKHPENELLVLCGHTHSFVNYKPLPNLVVLTAGAQYGKPAPQKPIKL